MYENRVSHHTMRKKIVCTTLCTQSTGVSPAEYEHQDARDLLHQSDGGRPDVDQLQQMAPICLSSETHRVT